MSRLSRVHFLASIRTQLLLWFLLISLVPCGVLTLLISFLSANSLERTVRQGLLATSDAKTTQIEDFIHERRAHLHWLAKSPTVNTMITALGELRKKMARTAPEYLAVADKYRPYMTNLVEVYGYENAFLLDTDANILYQVTSDIQPGDNALTGPLKATEFAKVVDRVRTLLQVEVSNYQIYAGHEEPAAFIAGPVFRDKRIIGYVVLELDNHQLFQVFQDYDGLGETGEAVVASREGDELWFVAPSRHDPTLQFSRRSLASTSAEAMKLAVQGRRGYGTMTDYRGEKVVAVWSYIPSFRWGMVVKQDLAEAFALTRWQSVVVAGLLAATVLVVTLVAILVARTISQPIRDAASAAERVAAGDLMVDFTSQAPGEAGLLLDSVRKMILDLRSLIGRIQRSSIALLSTATEIAAASRQQEQAVYDYGASTNQAAAAVNEISATSHELLKTMNEVNQVANQAARTASTGQQSLSSMDQTMRQLAESTSTISARLSVISERAANINLVVTTITKVADQTNLLSINAAIEAEKAGEYGLGFLVVAREIRRLADQTAVATLDIERMVKEMQYSVSAGVMEMDKFSEQVRQVVGEVGSIGGQLGQIITGTQGLHHRFDQVTEGMRVQSQGAEQIREAMSRLSEAATQTSLTLQEFNKATERLREAVGGLKDEVSRFTLAPSSTALEPPPVSA